MERKESQIRARERAFRLIPKYIEEGFKIVPPNRYAEWAEFVVRNIKSFSLVEYVLDTMKALQRGVSFEEAEKLFKGISLVIYDSCCLNIAKFAKRGVDFVKNIKGLNYYNMKDILFSVWIDKLEIENDIYEELDELRKMEQNAKFMYQDIENERE